MSNWSKWWFSLPVSLPYQVIETAAAVRTAEKDRLGKKYGVKNSTELSSFPPPLPFSLRAIQEAVMAVDAGAWSPAWDKNQNFVLYTHSTHSKKASFYFCQKLARETTVSGRFFGVDPKKPSPPARNDAVKRSALLLDTDSPIFNRIFPHRNKSFCTCLGLECQWKESTREKIRPVLWGKPVSTFGGAAVRKKGGETLSVCRENPA